MYRFKGDAETLQQQQYYESIAWITKSLRIFRVRPLIFNIYILYILYIAYRFKGPHLSKVSKTHTNTQRIIIYSLLEEIFVHNSNFPRKSNRITNFPHSRRCEGKSKLPGISIKSLKKTHFHWDTSVCVLRTYCIGATLPSNSCRLRRLHSPARHRIGLGKKIMNC